MQEFNSNTEKHYHREGLFETIIALSKDKGVSNLSRKDIAAVDEFHVRGAKVSMELAQAAGFSKGTTVLDVGCGIGGPARMLADEFGCVVTGIDVTNEFVRTARLLSEATGFGSLTNFVQGDALSLPFPDQSFDVVWTQHVQMNIRDKQKFYVEIGRVLKNGGKFVYYDIFTTMKAAIAYPVPWADDASISFLFTIEALHQILGSLGFVETEHTDQTAAAIDFFEHMPVNTAGSGIGLNLLLGEHMKEKFANLYENIRLGKLVLQSGISRRSRI